jgi:hypothetical protein
MSSNDNKLCEHCQKTFSTQRGLLRHQSTAKYCARARNLKIENRFECPHCEYGTCFKSDLNKHVSKCAIKNKDNPNEKEIERLKARLLVQEIKIGILEKLSQRVRVNVNL